MKQDVLIYSNGKWIKPSKWLLFKRKIYNWFTRFKIVDSKKYWLLSHNDSKYYFKLSAKEYEIAQTIYNEKGTISYEFCPCGGIGWGVKIHVLKTGEIIDITDVSTW